MGIESGPTFGNIGDYVEWIIEGADASGEDLQKAINFINTFPLNEERIERLQRIMIERGLAKENDFTFKSQDEKMRDFNESM